MHTPPKQATEAEPPTETFGWTLTRGEEKIDVQVTKEENDYLKSCSNQEEALEFLEKIVERQREAATAAEATQAENLDKPPSPTATEKSIEDILERNSKLEASLKTTEVKEPYPNENHDQNKACQDRQHEFELRTKAHLAAIAKKFIKAVNILKFQLDRERFGDDEVSKQYGDELLKDVEDFYLLADVNNDAELSKDEIRNFLVDSLKRNKFEALFAAENEEMEKLVNQIYDFLFADLFKSDDQENIKLWEYE